MSSILTVFKVNCHVHLLPVLGLTFKQRSTINKLNMDRKMLLRTYKTRPKNPILFHRLCALHIDISLEFSTTITILALLTGCLLALNNNSFKPQRSSVTRFAIFAALL